MTELTPPGLGMLWSSLRAQHGCKGWVVVGGSGMIWAHGGDCRDAYEKTRRLFDARAVQEASYPFNLEHERPVFTTTDIYPAGVFPSVGSTVAWYTFVQHVICLACGKWLSSPGEVCDHDFPPPPPRARQKYNNAIPRTPTMFLRHLLDLTKLSMRSPSATRSSG